MPDLQDWKRAVVHLEGAADNTPVAQQLREHPGVIPKTRDVRYRGTAVFLAHEDERYLLTARHVLTNAELARKEHVDWPEELLERNVESWIFPIIFRVPSLEELAAEQPGVPHRDANDLMNLGAGVPQLQPYTFSDPDTDLAIVSLRKPFWERFRTTLEAKGYRPIGLDDIKTDLLTEGTAVYSVGYPDAMAVIGKRSLEPAQENWESALVSSPVYSFGRVAMASPLLPKFWCDMSIYPGNSGGPVIEESTGKLVGIVSAQATVERVRVPFAAIVKAEFIGALIEKQQRKDRLDRDPSPEAMRSAWLESVERVPRPTDFVKPELLGGQPE